MTGDAVFLFHRDLRMQDNTALNIALEREHALNLVFVFDPIQIDPRKNRVFSNNAVQFMCESLREIPRLNTYVGDTVSVLRREFPHMKRLYQNKDASLFAVSRDARIATYCTANDIEFVNASDYSLFDDADAFDKKYKVFAPFAERCLRESDSIRRPRTVSANRKILPATSQVDATRFYEHNDQLEIRGGRKRADALLGRIATFGEYRTTREFPAIDGTTKASPHLKFGTVSVREFFWKCVDTFGKRHALVRELLFREFYFQMYSDARLQRDVAMRADVDARVPWKKSPRVLRAWKSGRTGFPIVDAAMRQLATTGWMHNRCRMIVANFLSKLCLVDWREGLRYFHSTLVDCDPFSNAAGWQWSASVGADAMPTFRIFNPFLQSSKYDKDAVYIKRWIPELAGVSARDIHAWNDADVRSRNTHCDYPHPIVDYKTAYRLAREAFSRREKKK